MTTKVKAARKPKRGWPCRHRVPDDCKATTASSKPQSDLAKLWCCDACGKREKWGDGWSYFGNLECKECGYPTMDFVACSERCRRYGEATGMAPKPEYEEYE